VVHLGAKGKGKREDKERDASSFESEEGKETFRFRREGEELTRLRSSGLG